jgi:hypothetical protein
MSSKKPQHNERARKSFETRYGMSMKEFRELKKSNPQEAHIKRLKALRK